MTGSDIGVLVMAYGGPSRIEDVEPYLLDVRGHRETPAHVVEEVRARYAAIGGRSPILERTVAQAEALGRELAGNGGRFRPVVGMRHWHPYIAEALGALEAVGVRRAVGLVMAPHYSRMSIGAYYRKAEDAAAGVELRPIERWHLLPAYLDAVARHVRAALNRLPDDIRSTAPVIFTAHSLPERILTWGDPYPSELAATVRGVMDRLGPRPHRFAYQSAALTPDPWLGPDVGEVLDDYARAGVTALVVAPIGFVCEHVEILYDIDVELARLAAERGIRLERIEMLNDDPHLIAGLAALVEGTAREAGWL